MERRACIIAVGSEMLTPFRVDTNSLFITERLNTIGFDVRMKTVVGDDVGELAALVRAVAGVGRLDRADRRAGPDGRRHHARRRGPGARVAVRRRRGDGRAHPRAFRQSRHGDAGDQPAPGDGAARGHAARQPERHGAGPLARAREDGHRAAAGAAARDEADVRGDRARPPRAAKRRRRACSAAC